MVPVPADTIVGLYHPFRDWQSPSYPNGIPFKNPLVTDPVRQQYVWRELAISNILNKRSVSWNPYMLAGASLVGNPQTALFYPLNLVYLLFSFTNGWTLQIIAQIVLGIGFMYLFLKRHVEKEAALWGSLVWAGSGFFVAWSTLNTLTQVAIWLPLGLLASEKIIDRKRNHIISLAVVLAISFFAGAWQIFLYSGAFILLYAIYYSWTKKSLRQMVFIVAAFIFAGFVSSPQILSSLDYFKAGTRSIDTLRNLPEGWFLPPKHLVQFIIPDFFGNPATGNYFGDWNYMEFIGYIGMAPLILAVVAVGTNLRRHLFWIIVFAISILSALPNPVVTFYAQPTRIMVVICFCLAVLSAFGMDQIIKERLSRKNILIAQGLLSLALVLAIGVAIYYGLSISIRNSALPLILFVLTGILLTVFRKRLKLVVVFALFALTVFDLGRFNLKFTPWSDRKWLFPSTVVTNFLTSHLPGTGYRFLSLDDRIMPPNFSVAYRVPTISGYDSTFPTRLSQLITAIERGKPDVTRPWGYNRILTPKNYRSKLFPLLSVKYLLSFDTLPKPYLKVAEEGQTKIYENPLALPLIRPVEAIICRSDDQETLEIMFQESFDPQMTAVCKSRWTLERRYGHVDLTNINLGENRLSFNSSSGEKSFIVFGENYTSQSTVNIDGTTTTPLLVNYSFQGIEIPAGVHKIVWEIK
jgi:uncharacterized membrane protein YfhO